LRDPDLLVRPSVRPLRRDPGEPGRLGVLRRVQLVEGVDREAGAAQQRGPFAVGEVKFHAFFVGPLELAKAALRAQQPTLAHAHRANKPLQRLDRQVGSGAAYPSASAMLGRLPESPAAVQAVADAHDNPRRKLRDVAVG
jgi:hypothetical protein